MLFTGHSPAVYSCQGRGGYTIWSFWVCACRHCMYLSYAGMPVFGTTSRLYCPCSRAVTEGVKLMYKDRPFCLVPSPFICHRIDSLCAVDRIALQTMPGFPACFLFQVCFPTMRTCTQPCDMGEHHTSHALQSAYPTESAVPSGCLVATRRPVWRGLVL